MSQDIKGLDSLVTASKQISNAIAALNQTLSTAFPLWTAGQIPGTTTNGNATAGNIGEYISSTVLIGSAVSLTTATPNNITSISLTGGDWDVWGTVAFTANAATTATIFQGGISSVSATFPTIPDGGAYSQFGLSLGAGDTMPVFPVGAMRVSLASTTTIYLVAGSTFAVDSMNAYGIIVARRRR